jgi:hypothetical protein
LLAMRDALLDGWQPRNSFMRLLVDTLMQVQSQYEHWLEVLTWRTTLQAVQENKEEPRWQPPRVTDSEPIEQVAEMVDRFHRIMMPRSASCRISAAIRRLFWCRTPVR